MLGQIGNTPEVSDYQNKVALSHYVCFYKRINRDKNLKTRLPKTTLQLSSCYFIVRAFDFPIAFGGSPNFNFAFTAGQPPTPVPSLIFLIPSVSLLRFAAATIGELTQYATPISIFVHPVLTPVFQAKNWDNVIPNVVSILVQVFPDTRMWETL